MSPRLSQYLKTNHPNLHQEQKKLGKKLSIIGQAYKITYSNSFRLFHSNQRQARLLENLTNASNEHAFLSLIAILKTLPREGELSRALIECISLQDVGALGLHAIEQNKLKPQAGETEPQGHPHGCFYYLIRRYCIRGGYFNSDISDALQSIHIHHPKKKLNYLEKEENKLYIKNTAQDPQTSLGCALAQIGYNYLDNHPKRPGFWQFCDRHTYQKQALLLRQLENATDLEAKERCVEVLLSIKEGELSKAIWKMLEFTVHSKYKESIASSLTMPKRKKLLCV